MNLKFIATALSILSLNAVANNNTAPFNDATIVTENFNAHYWHNYSTVRVIAEVWNSKRPVMVLIKAENGDLKWVAVLKWIMSTNTLVYKESNGSIKNVSYEEFDNMRLNLGTGYSNTVITFAPN